MKKIKYLLMSSVVLSLVACSSGGSGGDSAGNPTNNNKSDLEYKPTERWPEKGDYSYNYEYSYNGAKCTTNKSFKSKAEYCMGLQDQNLNSSCALPLRKDSYQLDCGDDFQEINLKGSIWISGFDKRLQKRCETGKSKEEIFKTTKNYCDFLKDENAHQNCFWDDRKDKFQSLKCKGDFSPEPATVVPPTQNPPAQNNPTYPNNPSNPPSDVSEIPVINELKANGIEVKIHWDAIRQVGMYPLPGEPSMNEKMKIFWSELELNKYQIIKRRELIKEINVTIYTRYLAETAALYLDFESKRGALSEYFNLFDKIINYSNELGIDFNFSHNLSLEGAVSYLPLRQFIQVIENNKQKLKSIKGLIKFVSTDSYSNFYFSSRELKINRDKIIPEFEKYLNLMITISPIFVWSNRHAIDLKLEYISDFEKEITEKQSLFLILEQMIPNLESIYKAGMLTSIDLNFSDSNQKYWFGLKKLTINLDSSNKDDFRASLKALERQVKISIFLGVSIENDDYNLDESYLTSIAKLETFQSQIRNKTQGIKLIRIKSYYSSYYPSLQELHIGSLSTDEETLKIINSIK